jgi:hypothetical protein
MRYLSYAPQNRAKSEVKVRYRVLQCCDGEISSLKKDLRSENTPNTT